MGGAVTGTNGAEVQAQASHFGKADPVKEAEVLLPKEKPVKEAEVLLPKEKPIKETEVLPIKEAKVLASQAHHSEAAGKSEPSVWVVHSGKDHVDLDALKAFGFDIRRR